MQLDIHNVELIASMRPRQMPRNFIAAYRMGTRPQIGFNEAAADAAEFSGALRRSTLLAKLLQ